MMRYKALAVCLLLCLNGAVYLQASEFQSCANSTVIVSASDPESLRHACDAADITFRLMRMYGMEVPPLLEIEIVDVLNDLHTTQRFGQFDPFEYKLAIMSLAACQAPAKRLKPFAQPMDRVLHSSFIAHEVAHAVAAWNFKIAEPSFLTHEYLAYVFQIASMPFDLRTAILQHIDVPAWQPEEIDETYYNLNPDYFAVKSYRHFLQTKDKKALILRLLAGEPIR